MAARDGFSLIETTLVLAVIGILLVVGLRSYRGYASNERTLNAARTLASDLRVAQQEAVTRRAAIAVDFHSVDAACTNGPSYQVTEGTGLIKRACLPQDVTWARVPASLAWEPTGSIATGATLSLRSVLTGKTYTVRVTPQTGAITDDTRP